MTPRFAERWAGARPQVRLTAKLAVLSASGVALNFVYQWYVLTRLGPGRPTDALFAGMMIPQLVLTVVSGSLGMVIMPLLSTEREADLGPVAWTLFQAAAVFWGLVAVTLIALAPFWVPLTVPGFDVASTQLAVRLSRIQMVGLAFPALAGIASAAYQARRRFLRAEASAVVGGLAGFGVLVWGLPRFGIVAAAWATVVRSACQVVVQLPALGPYRAPRRHPALGLAWRRTLPLLLGASYYKADGFVDRLLASLAPPGALSLYHLALQAYASAHMVLNRAVATPAIPALASLAAAGNWGAFARVSRRRAFVMLGVTLGLLPVLLLVGRPALALVLAHGGFSLTRIQELWEILLCLGGVWVAGAVGQVLSTSFYAIGDTRTPTRIGVVGFTLAIGLKMLAFHRFGLLGMAGAATVYYIMNATVLATALRHRLGRAAPIGGAVLHRV